MAGGIYFLNRMALKYHDGRAGHLQQRTLLAHEGYPLHQPFMEQRYDPARSRALCPKSLARRHPNFPSRRNG